MPPRNEKPLHNKKITKEQNALHKTKCQYQLCSVSFFFVIEETRKKKRKRADYAGRTLRTGILQRVAFSDKVVIALRHFHCDCHRELMVNSNGRLGAFAYLLWNQDAATTVFGQRIKSTLKAETTSVETS